MQEGLDPTLGAILPLVGVLLGVALGGTVTYALKRRDEQAEVRAAARVLLTELEEAEKMLAWGIEHVEYLDDVDRALPLHARTWEEHRLLLARHLDDNTLRTVGEAYFAPWGRDFDSPLFGDHKASLGSDTREKIGQVLFGQVTLALERLRPYTTKAGRWPF